MYKIGEFSVLAKVTIKTLRYYEKERLLIPSFVDEETGYRYYESGQLIALSRIIALRQLGLSIKDIKTILETTRMKEFLMKRKSEIEENLILYRTQLSQIHYLLEEKNMKYEIIMKELPTYTVYYKEGTIKDFSCLPKFIIDSAKECKKTNPTLQCIKPDYCYVSYLDKEFKDHDIKIRYAQAVESKGVENDTIKFEILKPVHAVCLYHKGTYAGLSSAYSAIMKYIEENHYQMIESPRERYIDGMWNKENEEDWLTEIQVPIQK